MGKVSLQRTPADARATRKAAKASAAHVKPAAVAKPNATGFGDALKISNQLEGAMHAPAPHAAATELYEVSAAPPSNPPRLESLQKIVSRLGRLSIERNARGEMKTLTPGRWASSSALASYRSYADSLSEDSRTAVVDYATGDSWVQNRLLEGGSPVPPEAVAGFLKSTETLKQVLEKAPRAPGGLVLFRTLARDEGPFGPGTRTVEKGFSSTALNPHDALGFLDHASDTADNFDQTQDYAQKTLVLRIIHLPEDGYPGLYMASVIGKDFRYLRDEIGQEHELLLPPGAQYEVVRNRRMEWYVGKNMEKREILVEEVRLINRSETDQRAK